MRVYEPASVCAVLISITLRKGGDQMQMKMLKPIERKQVVTYERVFDRIGHPGSSYRFPCDEHGELLLDEMTEERCGYYKLCVEGQLDVIDRGIQRTAVVAQSNAIGECSCGMSVELTDLINTCDGCSATYNRFGVRLTARCFAAETERTPVDDLFDRGGE